MKTIKCVFMMQGLLINCVGSPYLSGATTYAELNHPFTFICTVTVSSNPTDEVSFQTGKDEIAVLKQTASGCVLSNVPHPVRYSASCESGTADIFARSKNYTLTIKRISVNDITDWFCETKNPKNRSNSFKVKLKHQDYTSSSCHLQTWKTPGNHQHRTYCTSTTSRC
ncbi:uncharacterized protein LOC121370326 isoform X1 [Gigantopelta aegis]|uniref:uncharacterized protein LOC121370326 isoform X1 n=1 Tax=Gigantopelta aegis TaxID=1735272 RepID=UPI001B88C73A|nr:uncharacterized protein LOC121370326 isoform X1 [Gigantopelta aegis]